MVLGNAEIAFDFFYIDFKFLHIVLGKRGIVHRRSGIVLRISRIVLGTAGDVTFSARNLGKWHKSDIFATQTVYGERVKMLWRTVERHGAAYGRLACTLVLLLSVGTAVRAQQEPAFVHYWQTETQFNPAAVGRNAQLAVGGAFQSHASGFENAGSTMLATADMAFRLGRTRHGVGVVFQKDEIGLFAHQRFSLQYAYHFRLFGGALSVGAEVDMLNEKVDGSKADLGDTNDPAFPATEVNGSKFDASAGLWYTHGAWYVGLGAQHLTSPTVLLGETNEIDVKAVYNFTAGYNIRTRTPFFTIVPSALVRYDGTDVRADLTARLVYAREKKNLYGGLNYSPQHSVAGFVGGTFHGIDISYSYEAFTGGMGVGSGQHEVTLGYRIDLDLGRHGKNRHKSVRYL